jgi:hypothetical protein
MAGDDAVCKSFGAQEWPVHANTTSSYLDRFRGETELVQENRRLLLHKLSFGVKIEAWHM